MTILLRLFLFVGCFTWGLQANAQEKQTAIISNCLAETDNLDLSGEEVIQNYQKCLELSIHLFGNKDTLTALVFHKIGIVYYNDFGDEASFQKAIDYWQKALTTRKLKLPPNHLDIAQSHYNLSLAYQENFNFETALDHARESMKIRNNNQNIRLQAQSANELGKCYEGLEDYNKAIQYYQLSINKSLEGVEYDLEGLGDAYLNLGIVIRAKNEQTELPQGVIAIEKAIQLFKSDEVYYAEYLANAQNNLGDILTKLGKYDLAEANYQQSITFYRNEEMEEDLAPALSNLGVLYQKQNKYQSALASLSECLALAIKLKNNESTALASENLGHIYFQLNKIDKSLAFYQQAISYEVNGFDSPDISQNPIITNNTHNINLRLGLLNDLMGKANCFNALNQFTDALHVYTIADTLLDFISQNINTESSKVHWRQKGFQLYDQAINSTYHLYEQTRDRTILEKMFAFSEKNKAVVLLDAVKKSQAKKQVLPENLIKKEQKLIQKISDFERTVFLSKLDSETYQKNLDSLLSYQEKHNQFNDKLESDFPAYHQLKYQKISSSISKVQEELIDKETAFIEYFIGDTTIFAFAITQNSFEVFEIKKDTSFDEQILTFQQALIQQKNFQVFTKIAYQFYATFLKPITTQLPAEIDKLVIAPDGQLGYVPFQTFIKHPVFVGTKTESRYDTLSYLVNDYTISYAYSSALLTQKKVNKINSTIHDFGAFAPVFETSDSTKLRKLRHSEKEVTALDQLLKGKLFLKKRATVANFKEKAANFKVLHLSTHAAAAENADDTKIHFSDDYLSVKDIYRIPINAQLTVLSACETGVGQLQKGEGIISLERAFMYAGCPSLVTSLWQVDDKKTAGLMFDFYKNLKDGAAKNIALQKAQITYLKNIESSEAAHPFYWSAFILTGTVEPVFPASSSLFYTILMSIALVVLTAIGYLFYLRQKRFSLTS